MPGFEAFELLVPTDDRDVVLVYTRWRTHADFDAWLNSQAFQHGHKLAQHAGPGRHRQRVVVVRPRAGRARARASLIVASTDPVLAQLTGPGGPFEIVVEDVLGIPTQVYKQRMTSLRELMDADATRAATSTGWCRATSSYTYGEHDRLARRARRRISPSSASSAAIASRCARRTCPSGCSRGGRARSSARSSSRSTRGGRAEELEFGLIDSEAKVLIADERRIAMVRERLPETPRAAARVRRSASPATHPVRPFAELLDRRRPAACPPGFVEEDDLLAILYTSGTTGQPKGATLTHRQALANLQNIVVSGVAAAMRGTPPPEAEAKAQSASLLIVPLFHVTGCLATMMVNYVDRRQARVDAASGGSTPTSRWQTIERRDASRRSAASPRSCGASSSHRTSRSTTCRRCSARATAARRRRPSSIERIEEVFPNLRKTLATAYGLTETASVATAITRRGLLRASGFGRAARAHGRSARRRRTTASTPTRASAARCGSRART